MPPQDLGKPRSVKFTDSDWRAITELAKAAGMTRSKWLGEAAAEKATASGVSLSGTKKQGRPDGFRSLLYRDRYQLVARLENGKLIIEEFNNDTAPASVWRTYRTETPLPAEIYLDAVFDWSQFSNEDIQAALFLELNAWHSEEDDGS